VGLLFRLIPGNFDALGIGAPPNPADVSARTLLTDRFGAMFKPCWTTRLYY